MSAKAKERGSFELLVTADDYGICDEIDNGILMCIDNLDCLDLFVNYDCKIYENTSEARICRLVDQYRDRILSGKLKLGLHLTLTCGTPLHQTSKNYLNRISRVRGTDFMYEFRFAGAFGIVKQIDELLALKTNGVPDLELEMHAQYDRFTEIMEKAGLPGYKPFHISSHLGVYGGHPETYEMLKRLCNQKKVEMRCPVLMGHMENQRYQQWDRLSSQMAPEFLLSAGKILENGRIMSQWLRELETEYEFDKKQGNIRGTQFFIEHFFRNGNKRRLNKIFDLLVNTDWPTEQTFELVTHPVHLTKSYNPRNIPFGIKDQTFQDRVRETKAINSYLGKLREVYEKHPYQVNWKPEI